MSLTVADLHATLEEEEHLGWGYACCQDIGSASKRTRLDNAIVAVANENELTYDELLVWSNSKHGRWLHDMVVGNGFAATRPTVRHQLSRKIVDELKEGA